MAARDPAQEFEKGFGSGLRAQLDKRRGEVEAAAEKVAATKAAKKLEQPTKLEPPKPAAKERAEPAPVRIVPDQPPRSQELMEERKALDVRAKELAETKGSLDARETSVAQLEAELSRAQDELDEREAQLLRELQEREDGLAEREQSIAKLEQELTAHRREVETNVGRRSVELLAERAEIQKEAERVRAEERQLSESRESMARERAELESFVKELDRA